jgi:hypothetical protein
VTQKKALTRNTILDKKALQTARVEVPEWGGHVIVRELTGAERDAWEGAFLDPDTQELRGDFMVNARARLVALSVIDEDGARVFTEEDAEQLGALSGAALDRVFQKASRMSGLSKADLAELEKNLPAGRRADSGTS